MRSLILRYSKPSAMKPKRFTSFAVLFLTTMFFLPSCKKEKTEPDGESENTVTINPAGGTFILKNGLQLEVPPGAVDATIEISIELLDHSDYSGIPVNPVSDESLLLAFEGKPDGTSFNKAITIQASGISLPAGKIPILKELSEQVQALPDATLEYDSDSEILKITMDHFSAKSSEAMDQYAADECAKEPCKCKEVIVKQWDGDNVCDNGSCQVIESIVSVTYPACSTDPEVSIFREVTDGCLPKISLKAERSQVSMGESTVLTATVELGCVVIKDQSVDFVYDALGSISPTYVESDIEGKAQTTFKAGNTIGVSTIRANSTISYYTSQIEANGEHFYGDLRTPSPSPSATVDVEITEPAEIWTGTFHATFSGNIWYHRMNNYNYDANFSFSIQPGDWERGRTGATGTISISQDGEITGGSECQNCWIENLVIKNESSDNFSVLLNSSTKEISFLPEPYKDAVVLSFEVHHTIGTLGEYLLNTQAIYSPCDYTDVARERHYFKVPLTSDNIVQSDSCDINYLPGYYTLTLAREE